MRRCLAALAVLASLITVALAGASASALLGVGPLSAADATICGKYDTAPLAGGAYIAQNDVYGANTPQCLATFDVGFRVTQADHMLTTNGPASYPSIYQGCHYGLCSTDGNFPRAVTDLGTITSSWAFTTTNNADDKLDVPYDIWFDPEPRVGGAPSGAELMVWVDRVGDPPPIGTRRDTVTIAGRQWDVWLGSGAFNVPVISYVLSGPRVASVSNLPLTDFIADAQRTGVATRPRVVDPSWYLTSIEAGFEPWNHGTGLSTTSFSITRTCTTS